MYLIKGMDAEAREAFDNQLNAPVEGWAVVERRFFALFEEAG